MPDELKLVTSRQFGKNFWEMTKIMKLFRNELGAREKINVENNLEKNFYSGLALHRSGSDGKKFYKDCFKRLLLKSGPGHWTWTLDSNPEKPGP